MIKDIIIDRKALKKKSKLIGKTEDINDLKQDLLDTLMSRKEGVAISGIQIGVPKRIVVYKPTAAKTYVFINPKITEHSNDNILHEEGCLSFPGVFICTRRYVEVTVSDDREYAEGVKLIGLASRALQHEIDHLDGILMFEREYKKAMQKPNEKCNCKSGKKYKKCCGKGI